MSETKIGAVSRRRFLQVAGAVTGGVAATAISGCSTPGADHAGHDAGFTVLLHHDPADAVAASAPVQWALGKLRDSLAARGVTVLTSTGNSSINNHPADFVISALGNPPQPAPHHLSLAGPEANAILPAPGGEDGIIAVGNDPLGLVYALTELADRVALASTSVRTALKVRHPISESRANTIRGIFRMFVSEVEDKRWFYDREGWQQYFDMLVSQRFNRFNLSFGLSYDFSRNLTDTYTFFMYPFFVSPAGYNVRAVASDGAAVSAEEMQKNLETLKFISDQAALRGLQFNLGIWTHNYIWPSSPKATHNIEGLNAQTQAPYSRDAMRLLLQACPGITGITLRTHGESGVPEGSYDLWKIIMSGVNGLKNADGSDRVIELDLHGKTMTPEMIETALGTGMPVTISCKFSAEHMGLPYVQSSIRETEMPKARNGTGLMALSSGTRASLRYGIGDLLVKDRKYKIIHRVWPGTQRLLLWGDPLYAAGYGRAGHFAGLDGIEYFEPLSFKGRAGSSMEIPPAPDRSGYAEGSLRSEREWQKYLYTFRLLGRLSYNPDAAPESWRRALESEFGADAPHYEAALANASRILPFLTTAHLPCASNFQYWPEVYVNMSLYDTTKVGPYGEVPNPKIFGNVSSLDPQLFISIIDYVDALLAGKPVAKITPIEVARQLQTWSDAVHAALDRRGHRKNIRASAEALRLENDALIAAGIGQFFAHKLRGGVLWQIFDLTGDEAARSAAIGAYKKARDAWASLSATAHVYLPDLTYGPERQLRRHWSERLADIDEDIAGISSRVPQRHQANATVGAMIRAILTPDAKAVRGAVPHHTVPVTFQRNLPLALQVQTDADSVRLCYRHVNEGERYVTVEMQKKESAFSATIPAAYTDSNFFLQYYFEVARASDVAMVPGFEADFMGVPYFVVMQAS